MPQISIIVTAYNIEEYIAESLSSIAGQTLRNIEIIVVDDGSTDTTPQIIRNFAARDPRIKPILFSQNTIGGVASAANAGIDAASGDFIGFADGDDRYAPEMFEKLWRAAIETDSELAMCRYTLLDEADGTVVEPAEANRWRSYPQQVALDLDRKLRKDILHFISVPWRKLYRRDLVERAGLRFPVGDFFFEDNPFHWMSIIEANRIVLVPERLCQHRVARAGQTMATVDERLLRIFQHHDIIRDWLVQRNYLSDYHIDLLHWISSQLSWVSLRAEGDIRRRLFDILVPLIAQYASEDIRNYGRINGRGRTVQMLEALKAADYNRFRQAAGWTSGLSIRGRAPVGASLWRRGLHHLKHTGVRQTASMTMTYMTDRFGLRRLGTSKTVHDKLSNQDLMMALIVLQRDIRSLRQEIKALSRTNDSKGT
ncbi:glycosyltransferase family 2 protein [Paracoccus gahaiensis]|uniref:Glycosyltransferase family 2 protein n=1 Tax=Paracoccus gahaiensis TaxID=1706839 RepID=A0A4V5MUZ2_9RHOB|nr:glycosyltransferase family 2 protein [Paracoccus gahaiensis]TJZ89638.1 glycosyltransferase family 2 protein [Paracoccus gahaiensis]